MNKVEIIKLLGKYRKLLTRHELCTLRGQALAGDSDAAFRGLVTVLRRQKLSIWQSGCGHLRTP